MWEGAGGKGGWRRFTGQPQATAATTVSLYTRYDTALGFVAGSFGVHEGFSRLPRGGGGGGGAGLFEVM